MTRTHYKARIAAAAAAVCLTAPISWNHAQQPTVGPARNFPYLGDSQAEVIGTPADAATSDFAESRNYGPVHRRQYHGRPSWCDYWHQPLIPARPFGASVRAALGAQAASGVAAQMVLYQYDFDGLTLSSRGRRQALRISEFWRMVPAPIIIEPSGDPVVDLARKRQVVDLLQGTAGIPDVADIVIVDHPRVRGLDGEEAIIIHDSMLQDTYNGGAQYLNSNINNINTQQQRTSPNTNINIR